MSRTIRCPPRPKSTILDVSRRALLAAMGSTLVSRFSLAQDSLASSNGGDFGQRMQRIANGLRPAVAIAGEPPMKLVDRMNDLHVPGVSIAVIHGAAFRPVVLDPLASPMVRRCYLKHCCNGHHRCCLRHCFRRARSANRSRRSCARIGSSRKTRSR